MKMEICLLEFSVSMLQGDKIDANTLIFKNVFWKDVCTVSNALNIGILTFWNKINMACGLHQHSNRKNDADSRFEGHHLNPTNDKGMWNHDSQEELVNLSALCG